MFRLTTSRLLALRQLAPRAASALANPSARVAWTRTFASSRTALQSLDQIKASLRSTLDAEVSHELQNPPEDTPSLAEFLNKFQYKITTAQNNREVYMSRTVGDTEINITFCIDAAQTSMDDVADDEESMDSADDVLEIPFSLCLTKGNVTMNVDMSAYPDDCQVNAISFTSGAAGEDLTPVYPGPQLESLEEPLLDAISEYLSAHGINSELSQFIQAFYTKKEQEEYTTWLSTFKNFV